MWIEQPETYDEPLPGGLRLRTPATTGDVERIAAFNAAIHGPELGPMTHNLLLRHPHMQPLDQVFVENEAGEVVSALCLIPWTWSCGGALLPIGEMGIVGTSEAYRRRGLVREQVRYFKRRLATRGCVLSCIQGIPYFYRQFGYQYALPLEGGYRWEFRHIPPPEASQRRIRLATLEDVPALMALYAEAAADLTLHNARSEEVWRYLLACDDPNDAMYHDTWVVEDADGRLAGYVRAPRYHFDDEYAIDEASQLQIGPALELMAHLKAIAQERQQPGIRLLLPANSDLVRIALACGAYTYGTYAWQMHIPDTAALLAALAPLLERRLRTSPFAGWSGRFRISFYESGVALYWEAGALRSVKPLPRPIGEAEVSIPFAAFPPLVLGDRSAEDLRHTYPDLGAHGTWRLMLDVLFPKFATYIYTTY